VKSLHVVFLVGVPIAIAAFVLSLFLPERPLRKTIGGSSPAATDEEVDPEVPLDALSL
jgi:hypothetical protein